MRSIQRLHSLTKQSPPFLLGFNVALFFALAGHLTLNLIFPCVLPVISLKIMSFVQMSQQSRKELTIHGCLFSSGVLVSFWTLAALFIPLQQTGQAVGWGFQLQEPLFIAGLAPSLTLPFLV